MNKVVANFLTARSQTKSDASPNFPPFVPFLYHNIWKETKDQKKIMAYLNLALYLTFVILQVYGLGVSAFFLFMMPANSGIPSIISSVICVAILPLATFFLVYLPAYNACVSKYSIRYLVFFISYTVGVIFCIFFGIGFPGAGIGFVTGLIAIINGNFVLAIFCFISNVVYWVLACTMFGYMVWMNKFVTEDKASIKGVQKAVSSYFVKRSIKNYAGL